MFEKIKLKIIQGRQLKPFATARVLQDHEDRLKALEGDFSETPITTRDLSFTINDGTNPVEGATVSIGSKTGTTDSNGGCTIEGVAEGSQSVEVTATGFNEKTQSITVDSTHTSFTISLTAESATRDLSFTINDGTDPIKGATVKIGSKTSTTGDLGGCTLKDIEEGSQSVEVSATGYVTKTETITVSSSNTSFTISLVADQVVDP